MATTQTELRRDVLTSIRDNRNAIEELLAGTIVAIEEAARRHKNNEQQFLKRALIIIGVFWLDYQLLHEGPNKIVAGSMAEYADTTIGTKLKRVGATKSLKEFTKLTESYADDVAKGILSRKSAYDGLTINQRITTLKKGTETVVKKLIKTGIDANLTVNQLAKSIEFYIDPKSVSGGKLTKGNSIDFRTIKPGKSVPKASIRYNAVRISRTEIMHTYDVAARDFYEKQPWGGLWDWFLSNTHAGFDDCDTLAAQSPHKRMPDRPHPQCACDVRPRVPTLAEFEKLVKSGKIQ